MTIVSCKSLTTHKRSNKSEFINDYKVLKKLGQGSFAKVKLCMDKKEGEKYAIKKMVKRDL